MLGAVVLFCGLLGAFLWWLLNNYNEENTNNDVGQEQPEAEHQRRRNRGNKGKKRKQKGGKDTSPKAPTPPIRSSTGGQQRQLAGLDGKEWPTLAESTPGEEEEGEEDLAALHAEMLKNARSVATEKGGEGQEKAIERGRDGRKSGRVGVGDRVDGRYGGGPEWFPAVVTKTLHGGLVNLLYDDGERETKVPLSFVRHRGAPEPSCSDSDVSSESDRDEEETEARSLQGHRPVSRQNRKQADGWEVIVQKPKKTRVERVESRIEANTNLKNRLKRQKKREKELAAREALRKKL